VVAVAASTLICLSVLASSALGATSVTNGPTTISVATDTAVVTDQTRTITQTITIVNNAAKPARFQLDFDSARYKRTYLGTSVRQGHLLSYGGISSFVGPGHEIGNGGSTSEGSEFVCPSEEFWPTVGAGEGVNELALFVAAKGTVVLGVRFIVAGDPPWENADYTPRVYVGPLPNFEEFKSAPKQFSQFKRRTLLSTPRPVNLRKLAARIDLDVTPRRPINWLGAGPYRAGQRLTIKGSLAPARANLPVDVRVAGVVVARLITDASGKFNYRYRVPKGGGPLVSAEFAGAPNSDLLPDSGCPLYFFTPAKRVR
jgi:hypothetical protein